MRVEVDLQNVEKRVHGRIDLRGSCHGEVKLWDD